MFLYVISVFYIQIYIAIYMSTRCTAAKAVMMEAKRVATSASARLRAAQKPSLLITTRAPWVSIPCCHTHRCYIYNVVARSYM